MCNHSLLNMLLCPLISFCGSHSYIHILHEFCRRKCIILLWCYCKKKLKKTSMIWSKTQNIKKSSASCRHISVDKNAIGLVYFLPHLPQCSGLMGQTLPFGWRTSLTKHINTEACFTFSSWLHLPISGSTEKSICLCKMPSSKKRDKNRK